MKTLKHILWAFLATALSTGCSDDPTYTPGADEDPDSYGVYFPTQTSPTEVERDPAEDATVTYTVKRNKTLDAITVPVVIEASEEGIFEIEPIVFGPGEEETEFTVSFPNAKEGETYTCDIRIEDPHYISVYGPKATSLSFSVLRAGWELVTNGDATKGKWRDEIISNMYSMDSENFNPYPEIEVEIYQRRDIKGYYRMKVYDTELMTALAGGPVAFDGGGEWTIVDASDPDKVYLPLQSSGLTILQENGELKFGSYVEENFSLDGSVGQYGTLKDGVITFPAQSIMVGVENDGNQYAQGNRNGMLRILLPGVVVPDYTVTLAKSEPKEGIVEITPTFVADAHALKYSVFEGVLDEGQASLTAQDLAESKKFDGTVNASDESKVIKVSGKKTGKYTLVGCIYDKEGTMRSYAFISFGYVAVNDERPVILTMGLESTKEYEGQGLTSDNSVKFYAYGEGIESVTYGLFRTDRIEGQDHNALLDQQGTAFTAEQLEQLNTKHFSVMLTGLNGGSSYTLLMRANNGYISKVLTATYTTTGTYNPMLENFSYNDFLPLEEQPALDYLTSTTWNYYAINMMDNGDNLTRRKIGQVTITNNAEMSSSSLTVTNIKGLSGLEFEEGGEVFGMYIPNCDMFAGYNGALAIFSDPEINTGRYNGEDVNMLFMPDNSVDLYKSYGMFMGAVDDGYLYCAGAPHMAEGNIYIRYFFTGSNNNLYSLMTDMLLVDPAKEQKGGLSSAAMKRIAALRKMAYEASTPRNYVERPEYIDITIGKAPLFVKENTAINLAVDPMPASAPSVRKAETETVVGDTARISSQTGTFRRIR